MTMKKNHYEAIAKIIKKQHIDLRRIDKSQFKEYKQLLEAKQTAIAQIREDLADYFETENPAFKRELFLELCIEPTVQAVEIKTRQVVCGHCNKEAVAELREDGEILLCDCYFEDGGVEE